MTGLRFSPALWDLPRSVRHEAHVLSPWHDQIVGQGTCRCSSTCPMIRCLRRAEAWPQRGLQRPCLRRRPRPHDGAILVQIRDMEGDLRLVREGHRDSVAVHGMGAPRAGSDRVPWPLPRTCGLRHVSVLPALHWGHASHTPWAGNASQTCREHDTASPGQRYAGRRVAARDPREDSVPIWWAWSVACSTGEEQMSPKSRPQPWSVLLPLVNFPVASAWRRPRGFRDGGTIQHVQESAHAKDSWVAPIAVKYIGRVADVHVAIAHRQPTRRAIDKHYAYNVTRVRRLTQALPWITRSI